MHRVAHLSLLVGTMLAVHAAAQQPTEAQANAIRRSCRSDYQAHCSSVPAGGKAALQCLQQNLASLSSSCQIAVSAVERPSRSSRRRISTCRVFPGRRAADITAAPDDDA